MALRRYRYPLLHQWITTTEIGDIVPIFHQEVTPGDRFAGRSFAMLRMAPMDRPMFAAVRATVVFVFVPHRLVWDEFEDVITGVSDSAVPTVNVDNANYAARTLFRAFGIPKPDAVAVEPVNHLPLRAYALTWNELFRDQQLENPIDVPNFTGSALVVQRANFPVADYYSRIRNTIQQGSEEIVDVTGGLSVTALRDAQHRQRFRERRSQFGERYYDYLAAMGIRAPASRLDRPEVLARARFTMGISEVVASAGSTGEETGDLRGHGVLGGRIRFPRRMFVEHGTLLGLLVVRPRNQITTGVDRQWLTASREDFFQQEFATDTQVPVRGREVTIDTPNATRDAIIGYTARDEWLRVPRDVVAGKLRESANFPWTLHRQFTGGSNPSLASLVNVPTTYSYAFQDQTGTTPQFFVYMDHAIGKHSMVPRRVR